MHGLVDYAFALALLTVPKIIGCNRKTVGMYREIATEVILYTAFTKQPVALFPLIPMKIHKNIDIANLSILGLLTMYKGIRRSSKSIAFNCGMVAMGATTVLLTQWKNNID